MQNPRQFRTRGNDIEGGVKLQNDTMLKLYVLSGQSTYVFVHLMMCQAQACRQMELLCCLLSIFNLHLTGWRRSVGRVLVKHSSDLEQWGDPKTWGSLELILALYTKWFIIPHLLGGLMRPTIWCNVSPRKAGSFIHSVLITEGLCLLWGNVCVWNHSLLHHIYIILFECPSRKPNT